ncbi:MAG: ABC transporter substrate-binding protein [Alphaproteobacteria bacterium]|nr:ABC transporter substrate-binding protein [Alphaproteobacteria bacterium]
MRLAGLLCGIGAAVLLLAGVMGGGAQAADKTKVVIATDFVPHGMHAGLFLAKQKGWFDEAGLDVEILDGKGSGTTIQQVAAGQLDIGFAQLAAMAPAISNGVPVISVMGFVRAGDNGMMVPAESGWTTLKDLKGKKLAVPAGSATAAFADAFFKAGGVSRSDFTIVNLDTSALVAAYASGGVDGALSTVAYFSPIVADRRPSKGILFSSVGLNVPGYGLVVRKNELDSRQDMIGKFVAVQQKTWTYIFAGHQDEAVDSVLAERAGARLDRKIIAGQLALYMPLFDTPATKGKPLGWQAESDWESALSAMKDVGMVKPEFKPADFYTNRFIPTK